MAGKAIVNPAGALGYTDLETLLYSATAPVHSAESATTIAKGNVLLMGTAGKVTKAATGSDVALCFLIAAEEILAGEVGLAVVQGIAENVAAQGAISAGDQVQRSGTTAAAVAAVADTVFVGIGVAIGAAASSLVDVWVGRH